MLRVGFPSLRPETHTIKRLGMQNDIAFFQNASEFPLAKVGFASTGGSSTPTAFRFIQCRTFAGVSARNLPLCMSYLRKISSNLFIYLGYSGVLHERMTSGCQELICKSARQRLEEAGLYLEQFLHHLRTACSHCQNATDLAILWASRNGNRRIKCV
jgi:hypothetical protein